MEIKKLTQPQEIEKLASQILYHKKLYYLGKSILSDSEFDYLEDKLKEADPHHAVLSVVGYKVTENKDKITHNVPMISLAKTYSKQDLLEFLNKNPCVAIDKFDGMALSLEYNHAGKLIVASTRGSGKSGEDITEHVYHVLSIPKKLKLNKNWPQKLRFEIRGEIYFPTSEFKKYEDKFDSFRNAVPGTMGRKDVEDVVDILNCFEFYPYEILAFQENNEALNSDEFNNIFNIDFDYLKKIHLIKEVGFHFNEENSIVIPSQLDENNLNELLVKRFEQTRNYEIDGIVFRVRNERVWEFLGNTSHHSRVSLAFKQAGETA